MSNPTTPTPARTLPMADLSTALADPTRWRILQELARAGEPIMVLEIAKKLGLPATNVSKHINILRRCGLVRPGRANLYSIPAEFRVPDQPLALDYGAVLLRFDRWDAT